MHRPASRSAAVRGPSLTGLINTPSLTRPAGDPGVRAEGGRRPGVHRGLRGHTPRGRPCARSSLPADSHRSEARRRGASGARPEPGSAPASEAARTPHSGTAPPIRETVFGHERGQRSRDTRLSRDRARIRRAARAEPGTLAILDPAAGETMIGQSRRSRECAGDGPGRKPSPEIMGVGMWGQPEPEGKKSL